MNGLINLFGRLPNCFSSETHFQGWRCIKPCCVSYAFLFPLDEKLFLEPGQERHGFELLVLEEYQEIGSISVKGFARACKKFIFVDLT